MINLINYHNRPINSWHLVLAMLMWSLLFTNGYYFFGFEQFLFPNDRFALLGSVILIFYCFILWFSKHNIIIIASKNSIGLMIILFFIIIYFPTVIIGGLIEERQDLIRPALVATRIYAGLLIFFWLAVYCNTRRLFLTLHKFIIIFGTIWLVFFFIAYFLPDFLSLFYKPPGQNLAIRLNTLRFKPPAGVDIAIMYTCFYGFVRFFENPKIINLNWIILYILGIFDYLFVCMIRRNSFILLVIPIFYAITFLNITRKIIFLIFISALVLSIVLIYPEIIDRILWIYDSIVFEAEASYNTSTNIRFSAFNYYYPELVKSFFLGYGYYSPDKIITNSPLASGQNYGYYEGDLGIFMALLMYGVPGVIWTIILYYILLKKLQNLSSLPSYFQLIRNTCTLVILWVIFSLHSFAWGYHQSFWWGIFLYIVYSLSCIKQDFY